MRYVEVCNCDAQSNYECGGMMKPYCDYVKLCKCAEVALCAGRHTISDAKDGAIFEAPITNPKDRWGLFRIAKKRFEELDVKYVDIYVTGLTPALIAALNAARVLDITVTLFHYDPNTFSYYQQEVL